MTDATAGDRGVDDLEGDYLTVEQLAQLRQVTPAAIRAQLRGGNLAGEQVLQGQRTVWRIPVDVARRYLAGAGAQSSAPRPDTGASSTGPSRQGAAPRQAPPSHDAPQPSSGSAPDLGTSPPVPERDEASPRGTERRTPGGAASVSSGRVEALEAEVRRLRRQLSALASAHRRLLDALTADLTDDPSL